MHSISNNKNRFNLHTLKLFNLKTNLDFCPSCSHLEISSKSSKRKAHECPNLPAQNAPQAPDQPPYQAPDQASDQVLDQASNISQDLPNDLVSEASSSSYEPREKRSRQFEDDSCEYERCKNIYYIGHGEFSMALTCNQMATPSHQQKCKIRYGSSSEKDESWTATKKNRECFINLVLDVLMKENMRDEFCTVLNRKIDRLQSEDWVVQKKQSLKSVTIAKPLTSNWSVVSMNRASRHIQSSQSAIREMIGGLSSRRQLETKLSIMRRLNLPVPSNMRQSLAESRQMVKGFAQISEYSEFPSSLTPKWSCCVHFSSLGIENYLHQFINMSSAFDYTSGLCVAVDSGKNYLKVTEFLK